MFFYTFIKVKYYALKKNINKYTHKNNLRNKTHLNKNDFTHKLERLQGKENHLLYSYNKEIELIK